jgi:choline monooxygenase
VQTVGVNPALEARARRPTALARAVLKYRAGHAAPAHGAIWLTYYPTVMVEWYPHVLVVSTLFPVGRARR